MRYVLDDEKLNGPQAASVSVRPRRTGWPVPPDDMKHLLAVIELNCQLWGGAASPLLPLDQTWTVHELYRSRLRGAEIDDARKLSLDSYDLKIPVDGLDWPAPPFRSELALMFLDPAKKASYRPVVVPILNDSDPWQPVYAACLGLLPEKPNSEILRTSQLTEDLTFEDFIAVERVSVIGSASDLINRVSDRTSLYPRVVSMAKLAYGFAPSTAIRVGGSGVLPGMRFEAQDAGPNIVVLCTPGDVSDVSLLWNLRAAHGDSYAVPLGLLVDQFVPTAIETLFKDRLLSHQGIAHKTLYITSTSIATEALDGLLPRDAYWRSQVAVVAPSSLLEFGPAPSRHRTEVLVWNEGRSSVVPISPEDRSSLPLRGRSWSDLDLMLNVRVVESPFPAADDVRADAFGRGFFSGALSVDAGSGVGAIDITWPSRLLMLRVVCADRGLEVAPSEPGIACMTLLESLERGVDDLYFLAHAPLLQLLDAMAQRQGTAWARAHLRGPASDDPERVRSVAPIEDDLPEVDFNKFVAALGSAKAARAWLDWAEPRRTVVKGFPIQCEKCGAKQWIPVSGFAPPLICRGCVRVVNRPFPKEAVSFKYRLGEALRRVFESEAMGHLLVMRYFAGLFSRGRMVGAHPGINVTQRGVTDRIGEADVLMLMGDGSCIPVEVKRSFQGMTASEVAKLDKLAGALRAPWSVVAVPDWASSATPDFAALQARQAPDRHHRLLLTYDHLLDPHPVWAMGRDPFAWKPMTDQQIEERQKKFGQSLVEIASSGSTDWFEKMLLYKRGDDS